MQNFRALGALPPDPHQSSADDPHQSSADGGLAPDPPKQSPYCEFLAARLIAVAWIRPLSLGLNTMPLSLHLV